MSTIGFHGGCLMSGLGNVEEMKEFFEILHDISNGLDNKMDLPLVFDRLYKRYVRYEDIDKTKQIMDSLRKLLTQDDNTTYVKFLEYFDSFDSCLEDSIYFYKKFEEYQPLKITVVDIPWYVLETHRPLEEYDQLEGEPFWSKEYTEEEIERLSNL
ncbi:hypothetical protein RMB13_19115 [Acinetobacter sp. V102_4]|uniref:hypothetical protein n=1 Tax=Acinetobacter sp. V102_4 TaxID=3072984 RepID=UPI00287E1BAF|nr:hypothetical protein [Acinetobacter sp. V102_4]MDS7931555.1 hypothetical protein [Acinetobacter sp. V102_4]